MFDCLILTSKIITRNEPQVEVTSPVQELCRNMQLGLESPDKHIAPDMLRCVQRLVLASRVQLTVKQLQGFDIKSSFGSITQFAKAKWFRMLFDCNNDPEDTFLFYLYSALVIGRDINAERDILHINVTSPWFLFKIMCQIASGWVFT
jgi:hypothetical protein